MKVKAIQSFIGKVSMNTDDEREISKELAKDLINAGYVVEIKATKSNVVDNSTSGDEMVAKKKKNKKKK